MNLCALMVVRNEDWVLEASMRAALSWCDAITILDHASIDNTPEIIEALQKEFPDRIQSNRDNATIWAEMGHRMGVLQVARVRFHPTHMAMIDADEILTANYRDKIRGIIEPLPESTVIRVAMVPTWRTLDQFRDDGSVWCGSMLSVAFRDHRDLGWWSSGGYEHHNRNPRHSTYTDCWKNKRDGGVMHLQFANWTRLLQKHVWYRMMEHVRWPGRNTTSTLNKTYDQALNEAGIGFSPIPASWWGPEKSLITFPETTWFDTEIKGMLEEFGRARFDGLDLKGY